MPGFDVSSIGGTAQGPSGLLMGLDPQYQARQLENQATALALRRATAFQNGVPTTDGTPGGPIDFDTIARTQIQNGDIGGGAGLLMQGLKLQMLRDPSTIGNPTGQGGGGLLAGLGGSTSPGFAPAAGGGMIATAAGGDNFGRMPAASPAAQGGGQAAGGSASPMTPFRNAISSIESAGSGGYDAVGPTLKNGDFAVGNYGIMASNVPGWTKEVLGQSMRPDEFRANPQAQDAVFDAKFGGYIRQTGSLPDAASMWFTGKPLAQGADKADVLGTTGSGYVGKFMSALRGQGQGQGAQPQGQAGAPTMARQAVPGQAPSMQAQPISFGAPDPAANATAARGRLAAQAGVDLDSLTPAQQVQRDADVDTATAAPSSAAPIGDAEVTRARNLIQATSGYAPESLAPQWQKALTEAQATVAAYQSQQATPGTVDGQPTGASSDGPAPSGMHPYAPGSNAVQGSRSPLPGRSTVGGVAQAPQGGGFQPAAFPGAPIGGGQGGMAPPAAPQMPGPSPFGAAPGAGGFRPQPGAASGGPDLPYLQGQYARPGGGTRYVSDLLDTARRYALAGENQAAQAFETRAKQVQDDLMAQNKAGLDVQAKNAELTPEAKNYQDAVRQGFQGTNLDYLNAIAGGKANARMLAETSPQRLQFAGDEAAARAAAGAPYKFQATQPVPGGPTVLRSEADLAGAGGAVQSQPAAFAQKQEALGKLDGEMQGQFQTRQIAQDRLDAMANLLETFQSGAGADAKAAAVAAVRAAGIDIPDTATANPAAVEQFSKNATANVFQNAKDMGGRVLVSELEGLQKANANPNMQPGSNAAILAQQKGLLNWEDAHYADYSAWRQANPYATDASAFEQAWAKAHPVGAYVAAVRKDIAPLGAPLPKTGQWKDGQAYIVNGQKVRWDAASGKTVPFSGTTAPVLPGQARGGQGQGGQAPAQAGAAPVAGARQAPDGQWYVSDPSRPGRYLQVAN